jgi:hypothetical protein
MKRVVAGILVMMLVVWPSMRSQAQLEIVVEVIRAAIEAADIAVQKVQNQTLILQDAQKEVENVMAQLHLQEITDWCRQKRDLYSGYYQELWQVKNVLATYEQAKGLVDKQIRLVSDVQRAYGLALSDPHFSSAEQQHIKAVLDGIFSESVKNVDQLGLVLKAFVTQMSDGDRLKLLTSANRKVDDNYSSLRVFMSGNTLLSLQRAKTAEDAEMIKVLYGIK